MIISPDVVLQQDMAGAAISVGGNLELRVVWGNWLRCNNSDFVPNSDDTADATPQFNSKSSVCGILFPWVSTSFELNSPHHKGYLLRGNWFELWGIGLRPTTAIFYPTRKTRLMQSTGSHPFGDFCFHAFLVFPSREPFSVCSDPISTVLPLPFLSL